MSVLVQRSLPWKGSDVEAAHTEAPEAIKTYDFRTKKGQEDTNLLQASPYPDVLLDLSNFVPVHANVARRLAKLRTRSPISHLDQPYSEAFNFPECFEGTTYAARLYVVVFRSTINKDALSTALFETLHAQDHESYIEANEQVGGLLKYWFGTIDENRRNLATCVWVDRDHAARAGKLKHHNKAVELVRAGVYEEWRIERYHLCIDQGRTSFEEL